MEVVGHQAVGQNFPVRFGAGFAHPLEKAIPILVVLEVGLAAVASIQDMVESTSLLDTDFSSHEPHPIEIP